MKKLAALLTALLCLLTLTPAPAEEPAPAAAGSADEASALLPGIPLPVSVEDYKKAYEAILTANAPDCAVTWTSQEQDGKTVWLASINDSFIGLMFLADGGNVSEIACLMQGDLNENNLLTFLSMGGYGGAALLHHAGMTESEASATFMNELFTVFLAMTGGNQPEDICGLDGAISITLADEATYNFYFILRLDAPAGEE